MRSNGLTGIIWEYLAEACIALRLRCMSATATVVLCSSTPKCGSDLLAMEHTTSPITVHAWMQLLGGYSSINWDDNGREFNT